MTWSGACTTVSSSWKLCSSSVSPFQPRDRLLNNGSGTLPASTRVTGFGRGGLDVNATTFVVGSFSAGSVCIVVAWRQYMCWPPLIAMLAPVRNAASSLAR